MSGKNNQFSSTPGLTCWFPPGCRESGVGAQLREGPAAGLRGARGPRRGAAVGGRTATGGPGARVDPRGPGAAVGRANVPWKNLVGQTDPGRTGHCCET